MTDRPAPTIKDIARLLGVAVSTVGRALQNNPRISQDMRDLVHRTARDIGYVANSTAATMRSKSSKLVGFLVPDVEDNDSATIAKAVAQSCNRAGLQLMLAMSEDDPQREHAHLQTLVGARAAGLIIVPTLTPTPESLAIIQRLPFIQVIRHLPTLSSDYFVYDDEEGMRMATEHLLALGHRRIAYVGTLAALSTGARRLAGFHRAHRDAGLEADPRLIATLPPNADGVALALRHMLTRSRPTAVIAGGSRITVALLAAIDDAGIAVPEALSVIGFGDHAWSTWWRGGLTTLGLPIRELAAESGALLVERVTGVRDATASAPDAPRQVSHPLKLIVRRTTQQAR
ncbi:LacI family transcriptional regulator [Pigmentiphaga litoralis]|uniref:LacI family DNA-binding transcriptional regulator n=1 Tax=Pigmentiphaga litoralis TaxID=516702 RepID=UPI0016786BA0|nr:LacI family DNA-binding transcriptional regulator [Pigmentiphaga litoralis]GGX11449.1 LacI family transcriptional regulator [Pigmentiphaga litoralis]